MRDWWCCTTTTHIVSLVEFELMDSTMNSQDVDTVESGQGAKVICIILSCQVASSVIWEITERRKSKDRKPFSHENLNNFTIRPLDASTQPLYISKSMNCNTWTSRASTAVCPCLPVFPSTSPYAVEFLSILVYRYTDSLFSCACFDIIDCGACLNKKKTKLIDWRPVRGQKQEKRGKPKIIIEKVSLPWIYNSCRQRKK
jgi:hypothetical protein